MKKRAKELMLSTPRKKIEETSAGQRDFDDGDHKPFADTTGVDLGGGGPLLLPSHLTEKNRENQWLGGLSSLGHPNMKGQSTNGSTVELKLKR